jgi:hypothetical protein
VPSRFILTAKQYEIAQNEIYIYMYIHTFQKKIYKHTRPFEECDMSSNSFLHQESGFPEYIMLKVMVTTE